MIKAGITTYVEKHGRLMENMIGHDYIRAVINNGALPHLIPFTPDKKLLNQYIDSIDFLLLPGGDDIDPALYNEKNNGLSLNVCPERDLMEFYLLEKAFEKKIPVLGICRGCQVINVFMGGTLYQDMGKENAGSIDHVNSSRETGFLSHSVNIEKGSFLYSMYNSAKIQVNSRHHQAVKKVSQELTVSALSDDGIVEGIESAAMKILGVQWHPENLIDLGQEFNSLFRNFFMQVC
jgi:putative glutamine amidotransferase